jgi:hypothetical protein
MGNGSDLEWIPSAPKDTPRDTLVADIRKRSQRERFRNKRWGQRARRGVILREASLPRQQRSPSSLGSRFAGERLTLSICVLSDSGKANLNNFLVFGKASTLIASTLLVDGEMIRATLRLLNYNYSKRFGKSRPRPWPLGLRSIRRYPTNHSVQFLREGYIRDRAVSRIQGRSHA